MSTQRHTLPLRFIAASAVVLITALFWAISDPASPPRAPASQVSPRAKVEEVTHDAEQWVARLAVEGEGIVRMASPDMKTPARDFEFRSLGPLSAHGLKCFETIMDRSDADYEARLERLTPETGGQNLLDIYSKQLRIVANLEKNRLRREAVRRGHYFTIGLDSGSTPPKPSGVNQFTAGLLQLENGEWCQIVIWTDAQKHEQLREITNSLAEVLTHSREEGLWNFNGQPYAERRAWVDRYLDLSARAGEGVSALPPNDLRELLAMRTRLEHLRATVDGGQAALVPR